MSRTRWVLGGFLVLTMGYANLAAGETPSWGNVPIAFEANQGQTAREVRYLARGNGYGVFLTDEEMVLGFTGRSNEAAGMRPVDRNKSASFEALEPQPGASHYFLTANGQNGISAPRFAKIRQNNVWDGIDMVYYAAGRQLEYDFILDPGASVSSIRLDFRGGALSIDPEGNLLLRLDGREVRHQRPVAYQEKNGTRQTVHVEFRKLSEHRIGFDVGEYNPKLPLVIDPRLDYSTYWGGSNNTTQGELGYGITVDALGYAYVTGVTAATDFPLAAPVQSTVGGGTDAFVVKLSPDGNAVLASTYIGGSANDEGHDIKVDQDGNIYVTGFTSSTNFPVVGGFQTTMGGVRDAYLLKLSPDGSTILYSTFLGGASEDRGYGLAVTPDGDAFVTGATQSNNFPTKNAVQPSRIGGLNDAFVTKVNRDGTIGYSTYLGGSGVDLAYDIAAGPDGSAYVVGYTTSLNFPRFTTNLALSIFHGNPDDAFVVQLGPSGDLVKSILLGGSASDEAVGVALDANQNIYVTGYTSSADFPTWNALQPFLAGEADIFVTKIHADGSVVDFSTYWGSTETEGGVGIAVDGGGFVHVTGHTDSFTLPLINAFQERLNLGTPEFVRDGFLLKLNGEGTAVVYSTYMGGRGNDGALALAVDFAGNAYLTGYTASAEFPTVNALQPQLADLQDAFVLKFNAQDVVGAIDTQVPALGLSRVSLGGFQRSALFGYADVLLADGSPHPTGLEVIRIKQLDTTVSEVGLPLTPLVQRARLFVEHMNNSVNESIAIVNPGSEEVTIDYYFTFSSAGDNGVDQSSAGTSGSFKIPSKAQLFVLLAAYPFNLPQGQEGTLTLTASAPVSVTAVRAIVNGASNLILSRVPIHDLDLPSSQNAIIDHFVEGGGWHTQVVLVNNSDNDITGTFQFVGPGNSPSAAPMEMTMAHLQATVFPYHVPARSAFRTITIGDAEEFTTGFIEIIPDPGNLAPASFIFLEHGDDATTSLESQTGSDRFRLYAETDPGGTGQLPRRTALGITNSSSGPATLFMEMTNVDGTPTGMSATLAMPARTQISRFIDEIPGFEAATTAFRGLIRVTVTAGTGITLSGFQTLNNEQGTFLITTTGPIREDAAASAAAVFPYIPTGAQYTTSLILFGPANSAGVSGTLRTWDSAGTPLFLVLE